MQQRCWQGFGPKRASSRHARTARELQRRRAELCSARTSRLQGWQRYRAWRNAKPDRRREVAHVCGDFGEQCRWAPGRVGQCCEAWGQSRRCQHGLPGAKAAAVSTVRPLDTSPRQTCAQAASRRRRLAASSSAWAVGAGPSWSAASRAAASKAIQRPARKSRTRWSSASRPVEPVTRTRKRSTSRKSCQARVCCASPASRKARRENV